MQNVTENVTEYAGGADAGANRRLNLVVVGKSGVGKSSLLNYAAGRKVFETGTGDPVTQQYFSRVDVPSHVPGIAYSLFDTKGIENDSTGQWLDIIRGEIVRRDASDDIYDWMHTLIYCISAGDRRIEPFDLQAIKELEKLGSVIVAITKTDQTDPAHVAMLSETLTRQLGARVQVFGICNGAVTRRGVTEPSGIENLLRGSFIGLWDKAAKVLPRRALAVATNMRHRFVAERSMAGLCTTMALTTAQSAMFADAYAVLRALGMPARMYGDKKNRRVVPFGWFEEALRDRPVTLYDHDDSERPTVEVVYQADAQHTFYMPQYIARAELRRNYYRKAMLAWMMRWAAGIDEFYSAIDGNVLADNFMQLTDAVINEILGFYNLLTGSHKQRLVQTSSTEILAGLSDTIGARETRRNLVAAAGDIAEKLRQMIRRPYFSNDLKRLRIDRMVNALAFDAARAYHTYNRGMQRAVDALEVELRAYGQYFIRRDVAADTDGSDAALLARLRRMADEGDAEGVMRVLKSRS